MPLKWHKALVLALTGALLCSLFLKVPFDTAQCLAYIGVKAFIGISWGLSVGAFICVKKWGNLCNGGPKKNEDTQNDSGDSKTSS